MDSAAVETDTERESEKLRHRKEIQLGDAALDWLKVRAASQGHKPAVWLRLLLHKDLDETYGPGWRDGTE